MIVAKPMIGLAPHQAWTLAACARTGQAPCARSRLPSALGLLLCRQDPSASLRSPACRYPNEKYTSNVVESSIKVTCDRAFTVCLHLPGCDKSRAVATLMPWGRENGILTWAPRIGSTLCAGQSSARCTRGTASHLQAATYASHISLMLPVNMAAPLSASQSSPINALFIA